VVQVLASENDFAGVYLFNHAFLECSIHSTNPSIHNWTPFRISKQSVRILATRGRSPWAVSPSNVAPDLKTSESHLYNLLHNEIDD
jgi:hypothetical protein